MDSVAVNDDFKWDIRVRGDGREGATIYARSSAFKVGAPLSFDDEHGRTTALEYLLGALAADLVAGLSAAAHRLRVRLDAVEAMATGRLNNPLTYLGVVGAEGHPGLESVSLRVYVSTSAEEKDVRAAWAEALARSPLVNTLEGKVKFELTLKLTE